jgi:hypothetical protein
MELSKIVDTWKLKRWPICTAVKRRKNGNAAAATALLPAAASLHEVVQGERVRGAFLEEIRF